MKLGTKDSLSLLRTNIEVFGYIPNKLYNYEISKLSSLGRWRNPPEYLKDIIKEAGGVEELLDDLFLGLIVDQTIGCWYIEDRWERYRQVYISKKYKDIIVHRLSYSFFIGDIILPQVCHHCDKAGCGNPYHLFNGTHKDNMEDAVLKGRMRRAKVLTAAEKFLLWKHINSNNKPFSLGCWKINE